MTAEPLDELYFEWLVVRVVNIRQKNPSQTRWSILRQLFSTEFVWRIHNDENRVADGIQLRTEFLDHNPDIQGDELWLNQGCSFLEMLIALSGRLTFQTEGVSPAEWFWHLMDNVNLNIPDSRFKRGLETEVNSVLQSLNNRTYEKTGRGGLFPLHDTGVDQTQVEIWYQMNYYLLERS